jgi:hypothetical protein
MFKDPCRSFQVFKTSQELLVVRRRSNKFCWHLGSIKRVYINQSDINVSVKVRGVVFPIHGVFGDRKIIHDCHRVVYKGGYRFKIPYPIFVLCYDHCSGKVYHVQIFVLRYCILLHCNISINTVLCRLALHDFVIIRNTGTILQFQLCEEKKFHLKHTQNWLMIAIIDSSVGVVIPHVKQRASNSFNPFTHAQKTSQIRHFQVWRFIRKGTHMGTVH